MASVMTLDYLRVEAAPSAGGAASAPAWPGIRRIELAPSMNVDQDLTLR